MLIYICLHAFYLCIKIGEFIFLLIIDWCNLNIVLEWNFAKGKSKGIFYLSACMFLKNLGAKDSSNCTNIGAKEQEDNHMYFVRHP